MLGRVAAVAQSDDGARTGDGAHPDLTPLIVRDRSDLLALRKSGLWRSERPLDIRLGGIPDHEAHALTQRLNRDRADCGCSVGARTMAAGFVAALGWAVARNGPTSVATLWELPLAAAIALFCAGAGKAAGISLARRRARRTLDLLILDTTDQLPKGAFPWLDNGPR